jgi:hypothetical protein
MQAKPYIHFQPYASDIGQPASSASALRLAAVHFAEGRRLLRVAQQRAGLDYSTWLRLERLAAICHRLVVQLEREL